MRSIGSVAARRVASAALLALAGCQMGRDGFASPVAAYWRLGLKGDVVVTAASQPGTGTKVDLDDDLGVDGEDKWTGRLDVGAGKHRFGLEYLPLRMSGSNTLGKDIVYHGSTYRAGERVFTDLDLTTYALRWDYAVSQQKRTADVMRLGLGAWWWKYGSQVKGSVSGNDERRTFSHLYPGVNGQWVLDLSKGVTLDLSGALAATSADRTIWDVSAGISYMTSDALRATIGYRILTWDYDESTNDGDFALTGPFAAFTLRF